MVSDNTESQRTAFTVTVDAKQVSTGISAEDRARTIATLIDPNANPASLRRPGHVFPLRYREGGVLRRAGHTEAAVDLARMAGITPASVLCEIVLPDKIEMARLPDLEVFANTHNLLLITIADLIEYRQSTEKLLQRVATAQIPTKAGTFTTHVFRSLLDGGEHLALVAGDLNDSGPVLTTVHSECLAGDMLHSMRCDCGAHLQAAVEGVLAEGKGIIIYLRGQEGQGIGIDHPDSSRALRRWEREAGDTSAARRFSTALRANWIAAQILEDLGVRHVRVMSHDAAKCG
jgi:3,4-dihydroxy 2-butanone 4-phosphate synthase/GTP cyclohydrolase II